MSGIEDLSTRLNYRGGEKQVPRMNEDKLNALKKALVRSYQSATAVLADGREFRCLINPDHLKNLYDDKIISIPFEDVCLNVEKVGKTSEGVVKIGMKPGDVFTWKENNTDWLVFLQKLEETAYFRAEIRRCKYTVDVDGTEYKCYAARPSTNEIDWRIQKEKVWNDIDYNLLMYITKDEATEAFFHRFTVVKVNGKPWEVQAIDNMSSDGIIIMALKEWYQNSIADAKKKEDDEKPVPKPPKKGDPYIQGDSVVYPYEIKEYTIVNTEGGEWVLGSTKAKILQQNPETAKIEITTGRSGEFVLKYVRQDEDDIELNVTIESL